MIRSRSQRHHVARRPERQLGLRAGREPMVVDVGAMMGGNRQLRGVFLGAEIMTDRVHDNIQRLIDEAEKVGRGLKRLRERAADVNALLRKAEVAHDKAWAKVQSAIEDMKQG
mgnify:CR=1 FL=1